MCFNFRSLYELYEERSHEDQDDSVGFILPDIKEELLEAAAVVSSQPLSPKEVLTKNQADQPKTMDFRDNICLSLEKRYKDRVVKSLLEKDDETDITLFFKSIAKSVEKLPPYLQQRAKLETLTAISNIESEMWASRHETSAGNQTLTTSSPSGFDVSTCSITVETDPL